MQNTQNYTITIEGDQEHFFCSETQTLLKAMIASGKAMIPSGCHGGGCGVCKVRVLDGVLEMLPMSQKHVSVLEKKQSIGLACKIIPKSDLLLQLPASKSKSMAKPPKKYGFV